MTSTATGRSPVGLRSERGPVLGALMLCIALIAVDATILATAVPSIVAELGGFSQFPWLFSIYLLTAAVTTPLCGRLADVVGRRPLLLGGVATFVAASVLCGVAWSMPVLVAARALQGIGAGAIQPAALTVVGDLYTVEERARVQGYIASVWAAASVVGPALGGIFSEYLSWRWIFFVNVPLGALAAWMLLRGFTEQHAPRRSAVDWAGAGLLTTGSSLLILSLLQGGTTWAWASPAGILVPVASALLLAAFVLRQRRAPEPLLPLWVFRNRVLVAGNLTSLGVGALLIGLTSFVPPYVQGVLGTGPLVAGFALAAFTLGWPLAATYSGRIYLRIGFRDTTLLGAGVVVVGTLGCAVAFTARASVWQVAALCFVVGLGMGLTASPSLVAVQSVVGWERRGVVTGTNLFCRSMGSALGAAAFGAVANLTLAARLADAPPALAGRAPDSVDSSALVLGDGGGAAPDVLAFVRAALADASHHVFVAMCAVAVLTLVAAAVMPRHLAASSPGGGSGGGLGGGDAVERP